MTSTLNLQNDVFVSPSLEHAQMIVKIDEFQFWMFVLLSIAIWGSACLSFCFAVW